MLNKQLNMRINAISNLNDLFDNISHIVFIYRHMYSLPTRPYTPPPTFNIGMLLLDGFNAMAMQAFIDPFRCANYLKGANLYQWHFLGFNQTNVAASNGLSVDALTDITKCEISYDLLVINASWGVEQFTQPTLINILRAFAHKGGTLCGIDTGAFILAYAGLLKGKRAAVHYEHIASFRELFPNVEMSEDMFVMHEDRLTCCGGLAAVDMALEMIRLQQGIELANAASRYIFHERLRTGDERQLPETREPVGYSAPAKLREAIIVMERHLEQPLSIGQISDRIAISQRQLDRIFKQHTNTSPVRYYLDIRLDRARSLITQTELPILDVAIACGFTSNAHFSRAYKERFEITPSQDRIDGRVPFQFRSYPSYAGV